MILLAAFIGSQMLPGKQPTPAKRVFSRYALNNETNYPWFGPTYRAYQPKADYSDSLHQHASHLSFRVFGGTWCPDTKKWLPVFYKIVETAGVRPDSIRLTHINKELRSRDGSAQRMRINYAPTFIVYYDGKAKGRLTNNYGRNLDSGIWAMVRK